MKQHNTVKLNTVSQQIEYLKKEKDLNKEVNVIHFCDIDPLERLSFKQEQKIFSTLENLGFNNIAYITDVKYQSNYENIFDCDVLTPDEVKKKTVFPSIYDAVIVINSIKTEIKEILPKLSLGQNRIIIIIEKYEDPKPVAVIVPQYGYNEDMAQKDELQKKLYSHKSNF